MSIYLPLALNVLDIWPFCTKPGRSNETLALHIDVLLARVEVAFVVLELLLEVRLERVFEVLRQDLLVQFQCVLYLCDILKVNCVGDPKTFHLVSVSPLLEMLLEGPTTPVGRPTADFALELLAQSMQFEEPVWDWLAVPSHGQILWVILDLVILIIAVLSRHLICKKLFSIHRVFLSLNLTVTTRLLLSDLVLSLFKDLPHNFSQMQDPGLAARYVAQPEHLTLGVLLDWCFHAVRCLFLLVCA